MGELLFRVIVQQDRIVATISRAVVGMKSKSESNSEEGILRFDSLS